VKMSLQCKLIKQTDYFTIEVDFVCPEEKTLALIGPSGSGKTTIIRMLAGLHKPDRGRIECGGRTLFDSENGIHLSPQKREMGYVFQDYTLFPHLTIRENAGFAAKDVQEADYLLDYFGLKHLGDRKPHQVSGGERQRCAICQALAKRPRLLLLDEPFSALDVVTRRILRTELKRIKGERKLSTIYVTHDIHEALFMADEILPVVDGRIERDWLEKIISPASSSGAQTKALREPKLSLVY
ncbi:MAG: ATP-binding cassette domain-containing protein, partial [Syntrophales bacterium]|nr:ATP-binding cassette domain-containing protein [Syntrophales bacterium]